VNRHDQWLLTAPIYVFLPILVAQFVLDPSLVLVGLLGGMAFAHALHMAYPRFARQADKP